MSSSVARGLALFGLVLIACEAPAGSSCVVAGDTTGAQIDSAVHAYYDKFEDETEVSTDWVAGREFDVKAEYACEGGRRCQPRRVTLRLAEAGDSLARRSAEDALAFLNVRAETPPRELIFLLDGRGRVDVNEKLPTGYDAIGESDWELVAQTSDSGNHRFAQVTMPYGTFDQIASSDEIDLRLAGKAGQLSDAQKALLCQVNRIGG